MAGDHAGQGEANILRKGPVALDRRLQGETHIRITISCQRTIIILVFKEFESIMQRRPKETLLIAQRQPPPNVLHDHNTFGKHCQMHIGPRRYIQISIIEQ